MTGLVITGFVAILALAVLGASIWLAGAMDAAVPEPKDRDDQGGRT